MPYSWYISASEAAHITIGYSRFFVSKHVWSMISVNYFVSNVKFKLFYVHSRCLRSIWFAFHFGNFKMIFVGNGTSIFLKLWNYVRKRIQIIMMVLLRAISITFQVMNHRRLRDQLTNHVRKRIQTAMMFLLGMMNHHIVRDLIATKHNSQLTSYTQQVVL